ncbi:MAG TPA: hypothetical protein VJ010_05305, partial [Actinomycetota bacterium]|nr:hypothetical protein [Actinomycetota bacterium]
MGTGMDEVLESRQSPPDLIAQRFDHQAFSSGPVSGTLEVAMVLHSVQAEAHQGFDRIVFTFHSLDSSPGVEMDLPAVYAVSADAPPFTFRASGEPLAVEGRAFLRVNFLEMYGHASPDHASADHLRPDYSIPAGALSPHSPAELRPGLEVIAQICPSEDFQGYLEWIIGLTRGARWRVSRLDAPVRLLVDVENKVRLGPLGASSLSLGEGSP